MKDREGGASATSALTVGRLGRCAREAVSLYFSVLSSSDAIAPATECEYVGALISRCFHVIFARRFVEFLCGKIVPLARAERTQPRPRGRGKVTRARTKKETACKFM